MNLWNIKHILKKIFFLPPLPTLVIAIPCFGLVIYALAGKNVNQVIAYIAYFLSAYALVIMVTGIEKIINWLKKGVEQHPLMKKLLRIPFLEKYIKESVFRTETSLYQGFVINFFYAGTKLFSGIYYHSVWFGTLAGYYILLAVMRFSLLHYVRNRKGKEESMISEWYRYRLCGIILLFMNQALVGIIILVVYQNSSFEYPGMLIYIMALYTFYATITAVVNVIKYRKYGSPVLSATKVINLTAALVSMLSLETAMLTQFGAADDAGFRQFMSLSTGAGVSIFVLAMAVYMIIHATKTIRKERGVIHDSYTGAGR